MSLRLYFHPLSSYCQKALIALYEHGIAFEPQIVDLGDETERADFLKVWPVGKFPVLRDDGARPHDPRVEHHHRISRPALSRRRDADSPRTPSLPCKSARRTGSTTCTSASRCRRSSPIACGRPAGKIRPASSTRKRGCEPRCDMIEKEMADKTWAAGESFTMADCAAAPALFYANKVMPFGGTHPNVAAYLDRLAKRPSYARALEEAQPYLKMFPQE